MLTIRSAHSPAYSTDDGLAIALFVKFEEFQEELPFGATPHDAMPYGVDLYNRALAGEFGPVAVYVPPPTPIQPVASGTQSL